MIQCQGILKKFQDRTVLNNVSLKINTGQIYGLVGPNGAGKTTLCRVLCGIILPDKGTFEIGGFNGSKEMEKIRNQMGYMPQIFSLYGDLTVEENLKFFSKVYAVSQKDYKIRSEKLLSFTRLASFKKRLASKLSGGMYKKLALACALIFQPKYLLLDEPTIGIDPVSRRELWDILFDLVHDGMTIAMTTSYMDEAERCNKIGLLSHGEIVVEGDPNDLKKTLPLKGIRLITPQGREIKDKLNQIPGLFNLDVQGQIIHLFYHQDQNILPHLEKVLKQENIYDSSIEEISPYFEEVFSYYRSRYEKHPSS